MKNKPLVVFTGLALAAAAALLGATRDKWMSSTPQALTSPEATSGASTASQTDQGASGTTVATQAPAQQPAAEQPAAPAAAETAPAQQTAAAAPIAPAAPAAEVAKPTFDTVRVEKTGEAVIAGHTEPNAKVTVMLDGQQVGTTTANGDGSFVVVPDKALPAGSGALTIESQTSTEAAPVKSDQQVAVMVAEGQKQNALVAVISPDAPTKVLQTPAASPEPAAVAAAQPATAPAAVEGSGTVTVDAIDYDANGGVVFSGHAAPGSAVRIYVDNGAIGDATAGADGRWTLATPGVTTGTHTLRADALDAAGKVTARAELPFAREDATKVAAAAAPQVAGSAAAGSGASAGASPLEGRVVIQPGNNLWRIAKVIYGDGRRYAEIFDANKGMIKNPDLIYPGQVFMTPKVVPPEAIDPTRRDPLAPADPATQG